MEVNQRAPATSFLARAKAPSARHPAPVATEHAFTNPLPALALGARAFGDARGMPRERVASPQFPNPRYLYFADSMWTLRADA